MFGLVACTMDAYIACVSSLSLKTSCSAADKHTNMTVYACCSAVGAIIRILAKKSW